MNSGELIEFVSLGETSTVQFKELFSNAESISREITAMSNSIGGTIFFGIEDKTNRIIGLPSDQIEFIDKKVSECADNIKPPVFITTEVVKVIGENVPKYVLTVTVKEGVNKPYKTAKGEIYIKQGANKRLLTDNAEILRLFQQSSNLQADEMEVFDTTINDADERLFSAYFKKEFGQTYQEKGLSYTEALIAKKVLRNNRLTLAGLLFFGNEPQTIKPAFTIKTVSYVGNDIGGNNYINKPEDLKGSIPEIFKQGMTYLKSSLMHLQKGRDFNTIGILEISEIALIEILQNALIHRDYFKNSPIRLLIFDNRVEIISPGKLPNSLTVDEIKYGNPVIRNNQIALFSAHTLPYSGLGSGLRRAFENQSDIELINDIAGEQFIARIPRPAK
ncbi:transcriptional regulator [Spirochaetia bacterium]|nr:transcriptional regulator [Spirochaetia bacterium]